MFNSSLIMLLLQLTIGLQLAMNQPVYAYSAQDIANALPEQIMGWKTNRDYDIYDHQSIFDYIDGAGEVYRAYNLRRCISLRYTRSEETPITLDLFEMGSAADAFGVFTHDTSGRVIAVGNDGRYRAGWLSFWKDIFFVSLYLEFESDDAEQAVLSLGRWIAARIPSSGTRPQILSKLPNEGLKRESIRFLHHHVILNYHFYFADENILGLAADTDAVLAEYTIQSAQARLLLIQYPTYEQTQAALSNIFKYYIPEADQTGIARLETNKWAAASAKSRQLAFVVQADNRVIAQRLLKLANHTP